VGRHPLQRWRSCSFPAERVSLAPLTHPSPLCCIPTPHHTTPYTTPHHTIHHTTQNHATPLQLVSERWGSMAELTKSLTEGGRAAHGACVCLGFDYRPLRWMLLLMMISCPQLSKRSHTHARMDTLYHKPTHTQTKPTSTPPATAPPAASTRWAAAAATPSKPTRKLPAATGATAAALEAAAAAIEAAAAVVGAGMERSRGEDRRGAGAPSPIIWQTCAASRGR